jgi:hypothetical protein
MDRVPFVKLADARDGQVAKVTGTVRSAGENVVSPVTERSCIGYEVTIERRPSGGSGKGWEHVLTRRAFPSFTIVRSSGVRAYDEQVVDTVHEAGPFAAPAPEILSANGKVYIHWLFHRDGRQCETSGVDYFVLDRTQAPH